MGCVKDRKDNSFCAVKRAAISAPDGKSAVCDFYFSCCYAQYQAEYGKVPDAFIAEVRVSRGAFLCMPLMVAAAGVCP